VAAPLLLDLALELVSFLPTRPVHRSLLFVRKIGDTGQPIGELYGSALTRATNPPVARCCGFRKARGVVDNKSTTPEIAGEHGEG